MPRTRSTNFHGTINFDRVTLPRGLSVDESGRNLLNIGLTFERALTLLAALNDGVAYLNRLDRRIEENKRFRLWITVDLSGGPSMITSSVRPRSSRRTT